MRILVLPILLCVAMLGQSQKPPQAPTIAGKTEENIRSSKQAASADNGAPTKREMPSSSKPNAARETETIDNKSDNRNSDTSSKDAAESLRNWLIVLFTFILTALAGFQFWAMHRQAEYMRRGLHLSIRQIRLAARNATAAQIAADAANTSAKLAKDSLQTQRAFIQVFAMGFTRGNIPLADNTPVTDDTSVVVTFKNYGPTNALNVTIKGALSITPGDKSTILSPPIPYNLPAATELPIAFDAFNSWLDAEAIDLLKQERAMLQVSLRIIYDDVFGASHETEIGAALRDWTHRGWGSSKLRST